MEFVIRSTGFNYIWLKRRCLNRNRPENRKQWKFCSRCARKFRHPQQVSIIQNLIGETFANAFLDDALEVIGRMHRMQGFTHTDTNRSRLVTLEKWDKNDVYTRNCIGCYFGGDFRYNIYRERLRFWTELVM